MLNYNNKCINSISLLITILVCLILFIILDFCLLNIPKQNNNENINISRIELGKYSSIKRKNIKNSGMDIGKSFLELMQIADIYDENTKVEEVENNKKKKEIEKETIQAEYTFLDENNKWRIKIPKINVDAPIKSGTTQKILGTAVGHFENTTTWNGNVVLAGHNRGYNCNFFKNLKLLSTGDEIIYYTKNGKRKYKVILNKIIKQTDWSYTLGTKDNRITLITCVENMSQYRRCIQAIEIM